ncbi:enoyl-CoA hydratase-related protein [Nocardioides campestrisoli]|uniref:enoyl-CoA hydratase-related protein n=1 Tax=Nocardioides campestrisoli TaxID=2736757 RepID=UPI0015E6D158|nr:enoyl-CoA hydratase-related protein [Nocardioides campestrisoli]
MSNPTSDGARYENVEVEVDGAVATITLNRPDRINALSPQLRADLEAALAELKPGDAVRVIRIRGAGRGFCSGYDMDSGSSIYKMAPGTGEQTEPPAPGTRSMVELGESSAVLDRERIREGIERWLAIMSYRKPIVSQVHGYCLAGGLDLIGVTDVVYAAEDAKFGHPAGRGLGIPPTLGLLPQKIGLARAKELFFTGDTVDGVEAQRLGIVNKVFPADQLDDATMALCRRMAQVPLDSLTLHKSVINRWGEIMGLRLGALEGAEFDALFHVTPASVEFGRISGSQGLREALAWRDGPFRS